MIIHYGRLAHLGVARVYQGRYLFELCCRYMWPKPQSKSENGHGLGVDAPGDSLLPRMLAVSLKAKLWACVFVKWNSRGKNTLELERLLSNTTSCFQYLKQRNWCFVCMRVLNPGLKHQAMRKPVFKDLHNTPKAQNKAPWISLTRFKPDMEISPTLLPSREWGFTTILGSCSCIPPVIKCLHSQPASPCAA